MQRKLGFCAIYVTHDQDEAMAMAERLAVMRNGKVAQLGTPRELYESPTSRYVSDFIGSSNEVPGVVTAIRSTTVVVRTAIGPICGVDGCGGLSVGDDVVATWRPERSRLQDPDSAPSANCWTASLEGSMFLGSYTEHALRVGGQELRLWTTTSEPPGADGLRLAVDPECVRILPAA
jgi:iron(III) transport system ATP-binding protein